MINWCRLSSINSINCCCIDFVVAQLLPESAHRWGGEGSGTGTCQGGGSQEWVWAGALVFRDVPGLLKGWVGDLFLVWKFSYCTRSLYMYVQYIVVLNSCTYKTILCRIIVLQNIWNMHTQPYCIYIYSIYIHMYSNQFMLTILY